MVIWSFTNINKALFKKKCNRKSFCLISFNMPLLRKKDISGKTKYTLGTLIGCPKIGFFLCRFRFHCKNHNIKRLKSNEESSLNNINHKNNETSKLLCQGYQQITVALFQVLSYLCASVLCDQQ